MHSKTSWRLVPLGLAAIVIAVGVVAGASAAPMSHSNARAASFASAADANCAALYKLIAPLGNPAALPAIAHKLSIVVPAFTMALRAQAELGQYAAPAGQSSVVSRWMAAMTGYGRKLGTIEKAAAGGNGAAVSKANGQLTAIGARAAALSQQLGLHVCFAS